MVILGLTYLDRLEHARFFVRTRLTLSANPMTLRQAAPETHRVRTANGFLETAQAEPTR